MWTKMVFESINRQQLIAQKSRKTEIDIIRRPFHVHRAGEMNTRKGKHPEDKWYRLRWLQFTIVRNCLGIM